MIAVPIRRPIGAASDRNESDGGLLEWPLSARAIAPAPATTIAAMPDRRGRERVDSRATKPADERSRNSHGSPSLSRYRERMR